MSDETDELERPDPMTSLRAELAESHRAEVEQLVLRHKTEQQQFIDEQATVARANDERNRGVIAGLTEEHKKNIADLVREKDALLAKALADRDARHLAEVERLSAELTEMRQKIAPLLAQIQGAMNAVVDAPRHRTHRENARKRQLREQIAQANKALGDEA